MDSFERVPTRTTLLGYSLIQDKTSGFELWNDTTINQNFFLLPIRKLPLLFFSTLHPNSVREFLTSFFSLNFFRKAHVFVIRDKRAEGTGFTHDLSSRDSRASSRALRTTYMKREKEGSEIEASTDRNRTHLISPIPTAEKSAPSPPSCCRPRIRKI